MDRAPGYEPGLAGVRIPPEVIYIFFVVILKNYEDNSMRKRVNGKFVNEYKIEKLFKKGTKTNRGH